MDLSPSDWDYVNERAEAFVGREWVFARVRSFLAGPSRVFLLCGGPGMGKTAVAARLVQASRGRNVPSGRPPVDAGEFDAAVFCRAGRVDLLDVAQRLSAQLSAAVPEFKRELQAVLTPEIRIENVRVEAGSVADGADVTGVRIALDRLGPERAFSTGVALPLMRLADSGSRPVVILVDALDEAVSSPMARDLPHLLGELVGIKLIATARDDPRVFAHLGGPFTWVHIRDDAPPDSNDLLDFVTDQLRGHGPELGMRLLARRIANEAAGNFLYCKYVTAALVASGALFSVDEEAAQALSLPRGGLPGVYREFLRRELARDETAWSKDIRPVLAPLAVARGEGFTTAQLAAIGSQLVGRRISRSRAGDVTRIARQFLEGPDPGGPFRPFHQSFAEFLTSSEQNPDWPIDAAEVHEAIAAALLADVPEDEHGVKQWAAEDFYTGRKPDDGLTAGELPRHARYLWRYLVYHLIKGHLTGAAISVVSDLWYLTLKTYYADAYAAMHDVAEVQSNSQENSEVRAIYRFIEQGAHILERCENVQQIARTLFARGYHQTQLRRSVGRLAARLPDGVLCPVSPMPDLPHPALLRTLSVPHGVIVDMDVDREATVVAAAYRDGALLIWNGKTGQMRALIHGNSRALCCAVSADGSTVVSGHEGGVLKTWDADAGREKLVIKTGHKDGIHDCAVDRNADILVSASTGAGLQTWDGRTGRPGVKLAGGSTERSTCAVTAAGDRVIHGAADGAVLVWDTATGRQIAALHGDRKRAADACAVTSDGRFAVLVATWHYLEVWDLTGMRARRMPASWCTSDCAVNSDGRIVVAIPSSRIPLPQYDKDETGYEVEVWDTHLGKEVARFPHGGAVNSCAVSSDGGTVVSGGSDGAIRIWDVDQATAGAGHRHDHSNYMIACSISSDGRFVISASYSQMLRRDRTTGEQVIVATTQASGMYLENISACAVSNEGAVLLASNRGCRLYFPETQEMLIALESTGLGPMVDACALSSDGRVAAWLSHGELGMWDTSKRQSMQLSCNLLERSEATVIALSQDGEIVVVGYEDGTVLIVGRTPSGVREVSVGSCVTRCAVSTSGTVAVGGADGSVSLCRLGEDQAQQVGKHPSSITGCALNDDGTLLVTTSKDGQLQARHASRQTDTATILLDDNLNDCACDGAGTMMVAAGHRGLYDFRITNRADFS